MVILLMIEPGAPQNVQASTVLADKIILRWDPPAQSKGSLTYEVYQLSPLRETPFKVPPSQTSFTVTGLDAYKTYKFAVSAKNSLGSGVKSEAVTVQTIGTTPGIVEYVTTEPVPPYSASIRVTWSTPSKPNGAIKNYKIKWGKTIVEDPSKTDNFEVMTVDGSESAFTFKHLFSNTYYSFVVTAVNNIGEGFQHINPKKERTDTASKGTETLSMTFTGPIMAGDDTKDFIHEFIKVASVKAKLLEDRIAAIYVERTKDPSKGAVVFDLIPPLNSSGVPMEMAKAAINNGFKARDWTLDSGSLRTVSRVDVTAAPGEKPSVGAQKGGSPNDGSQKKTLAIIIPLALIGVALLVGLIFYYMKYKSLEKHYRQMNEKDHDEDEMKVVYNEDMEADSPDNIFGDHMKKGRSKVYRDSEKVPLGESDELAMI